MTSSRRQQLLFAVHCIAEHAHLFKRVSQLWKGQMCLKYMHVLHVQSLFAKWQFLMFLKLTKNTVGVNNIMLYLLPRDMCDMCDMTVRLQSWSRNVGKLDGASLLCSSGCQFSALKIPATTVKTGHSLAPNKSLVSLSVVILSSLHGTLKIRLRLGPLGHVFGFTKFSDWFETPKSAVPL